MSKKYRVDGPEGEIIIFHFQDINREELMVGCSRKYKPFMDHLLFTVMGYLKKNVRASGVRQVYKYRYYIETDTLEFKELWYRITDKYKVTEVQSIIQHS